jgi:8-oxo-dGTP pyrophosphatase MutT (NUDIX family)
MVREFSAGALVLRHMQKQWWVAVIEPGYDGEPEDRKNTVTLPKGNVNPGEEPLQTAIRELYEETGLRARPVAKLADIKYVYRRKWLDDAKIFKVVSFYLMTYLAGQIGDIQPNMRIEVRRAYWLTLEESARRLSYRGERGIAQRAIDYLANDRSLKGSSKAQ